MIFGHINNTDAHHYPPAIARAIAYLATHDLAGMAAGRYQDSETGWQVQVLDLHTAPTAITTRRRTAALSTCSTWCPAMS